VLRLVVLALALLALVARASAHGSLPAATELLAHSAGSATLVRLAPGGLAYRVPDGFRFVCPEAWGGDVLAPAAAIPAGRALIASDALFVVEQDGRVSPHPIQAGSGVVVTNNRDAAFGVFKHEGRYELRRVTEGTNDLVRVLEQPFGALVASDREVSLLRWLDSTLVLQRMSLTGELRESLTWTVPNAVAYARLRTAGDSLYVLVWGRSAPWVTLGRVTARGYEPMREASSDIAGPVALAVDPPDTLVALDGTIERLEGGTSVDAHGNRATCLGTNDAQPYACVHGDLLRVDPGGLGAPLFELSALREPDYQTLPAALRMDCSTRWLDLRDHVASLLSSGSAADAGVADAATPDAATLTPGAGRHSGCSLGASSGRPGPLLLYALMLFFAAARSRRGGRGPRTS